MYELELLEPTKELEAAIMEYRQEYILNGEKINGSLGLVHYDDYSEWLEKVNKTQKAETSPLGVATTTYFSIRKSDGKIIGTIQLRHDLTDELREHGGHIGYGVRPSERGKGYGKQQLMLVLDIARQMGIQKVMISCTKDNIASRQTAISCGGVLARENIYKDLEQQIFWINLQ
ncbi:MAG: GNAT family N-acetyltransferase [Defluviitaleaceae bacterium]|nr:GNAT family N-acetyltransferase [Defluviitaleaceae bacterium]